MAGSVSSASSTAGLLHFGTCSWTDESLVRCHKFYPGNVKTDRDRLAFYASTFPCVEVDSSNYAIPSEAKVKAWVDAVPKGFLIHFKAFQIFALSSCPPNALPYLVKETLSDHLKRRETVSRTDLSDMQMSLLWEHWNTCLKPAHDAGKLGVIVFQFRTNFHPSAESKRQLLDIRSRLDPKYKLAFEFRSRAWFAAEQVQDTMDFMKANDLPLILVDELESELAPVGAVARPPWSSEGSSGPSSSAAGATAATSSVQPSGAGSSTANPPITEPDRPGRVSLGLHVPVPSLIYVRIHRREGTDRLLGPGELQRWAQRVKHLHEQATGPIYFLWNTNYENQSMTNAKRLTELVPDLVYNWKSERSADRGTLMSMFGKSQAGSSSSSSAKPDAAVPRSQVPSQGVKRSHNESEQDDSDNVSTVEAAALPTDAAPPNDDDSIEIISSPVADVKRVKLDSAPAPAATTTAPAAPAAAKPSAPSSHASVKSGKAAASPMKGQKAISSFFRSAS
ncbi:hypothetical protein CAOG_06328 [Capsaspora owczarzaki ATCC 30864]|uniref:DUF72 domain-containing protein n=1 Tax=Capsaspora owczarzaki (strain ATCC 30864) TaxID=595528 RepID=A0A0D2ULF9_CAPO3|nr:hypothetical protein CAOG_06328 [Capsaspora owczarzaki ATCC 30864]KJE95941.1 hypothetical protein CAOG_006328 [Capsaspora owczarzaki ATCC 30864]|eukprot:XP_004345077.1 hypothetical protein CAOG_06328 [Capsaspora owczarzaki ATCC 30864]